MFEALLQLEIGPEEELGVERVEHATPDDMLKGMLHTADLMKELGVPTDEEIDARLQRQDARDAFTAINFDPEDEAQKVALAKLKVPEAVHHLVGMLSAYDWEFVNQAKELRGYTVAQIVELTQNNDPKVRLKALKMLGDVTEVGLFTTKVEVKNVTADEAEINRRLEERLQRYLDPQKIVDVAAKTVPDAQ